MTRLALVGLVAINLGGCRREAPGPYECHDFARDALGVPEGVERLPPRAQLAVEELTRDCITTPYDRKLLRCVEERRSPRRCLVEFKRRLDQPVDRGLAPH